jgi:hypothetical protein
MLDSKPFPDFRDGKKRRESLCIFAKSLETDEALRLPSFLARQPTPGLWRPGHAFSTNSQRK